MKNYKPNLRDYSALAAGILLISGGDDINYVDIDPDIIVDLDSPHALIDINDDGINDFQFNVGFNYITTGWYTSTFLSISHATMQPLSGASVLASGTESYYLGNFAWYSIKKAESGFNIFDGLSWKSYPAFIDNIFGTSYTHEPVGLLGAKLFEFIPDESFSTTFYRGQLVGVTDKYVGLRINMDGEPHFGWIRLSVNNIVDEIIIHDYAYQLNPNIPILAGDGVELFFCEAPNIISSLAYPTSAKLKWEAVEGAVSYQIRYRPVGAATWTNKTVDAPKTTKIISGLTCTTDYEWKIRSQCDDGSNSEFSLLAYFTTDACRIDTETLPIAAELYPNPVSEYLTVDLENAAGDIITLEIFDLKGRLLKSVVTESNTTTIDVKDLPAGNYMLKIGAGTTAAVEKFIVQ